MIFSEATPEIIANCSTVLRERVAAVSVGLVNGQPMLDLCYEEDVGADVDVNVVMGAGGRFIEVQGTAEGCPFGREQLDGMLDLAGNGLKSIFHAQQLVIDRYVE